MIALWWALACPVESEELVAPRDPLAGVTPLPAPRLLRRISLDLRGVLPSLAELDAVEADPSSLAELIAPYFATPTFEDRFVSLLSERWHTVLDTYEVGPGDYALPPGQGDQFAHSVGEEPLRLIAHVVAQDRPWDEIVTAEYTMADELLASIWPIDYPTGGAGWQESTYRDGRPAAGVLATNGFYWRYVTNVSNKSRGRAAAVSRLLLCSDILSRPVVFERSQAVDPEDAVRTEPACAGCHATLDPLAASMFGFWWTIQYNPYEMETYHRERERLGPELLGTEPGWYGTPIDGLIDLGWAVSHDPRFTRCATESLAEGLWHRRADLDDYGTVETLRVNFEDDGRRPQALLRAIVATPQYGAAADGTHAVEHLLSPNQLRLVLEDLAGLHWVDRGYTVLENDALGLRVLAGGVDGYSVTRVQSRPGLTWTLVNQRAAQAAASELVARDLDADAAEVLAVSSAARPGDETFTTQLGLLHWRLYATRAPEGWLTDIAALWAAVELEAGPASAWEAVIEAMLRDPLFVSY
ncbi:MAG: DUF1585 domain-containing protein [Myxococcales bacterium]|nr:DUF1585 domain-containing protein [Myxococcales bacterium]